MKEGVRWNEIGGLQRYPGHEDKKQGRDPISFGNWAGSFNFFWLSFFFNRFPCLTPYPHLISDLPLFPFLAHPFVFLQVSILLHFSPMILIPFSVLSVFVYQCLTTWAPPPALVTFAWTLSLTQRKKIFFFLLSTVKPKETSNVYFSYDIFLMLLSDRNLEK